MFKKFIIFISFFFLISCVTPTGAVINESDISLTETRKVIFKMFGEPKSISQNGRELITEFMDKKGRILESAKKGKERRYAHITILGERRPYKIVVNAVVETLVEGNEYEIAGDDEVLSESLAKDLKKELLKSLDNRNMFDDFKPF